MNCNGHAGFPLRRFFWSNGTSFQFSELAGPKDSLRSVFDQLQGYFSGEHQRVLVDKMGFCSVTHLAAGSFDPKDLPAGGLTELDRLSYTVHQIDQQCSIVPVGSYKRTPLGEIQRNEAFRGLKHDASNELKNYMIFRPAHQRAKKEASDRKDDVFVADFLDNAAEVANKGGWTIVRDTT